MADPSGVWRAQASQWERVGPPLRPSPSDGAVLEGLARDLAAPRVLVLGVTPEMAGLAWPTGTRLLAVDRAPEMIDRVWPGHPGPGQGALLADWLHVELPAAAFDLMVSDGCFGVLPTPAEHEALMGRARDWLAPHGRFAFRVFVRPDPTPSPADVLGRAMVGGFASFHAFKLALLFAVQGDADGVRTGDVHDVWSAGPGPERLAHATGWPDAQIRTIDAYRGQDTVYAFPTEAMMRERLARTGLSVVSVHHGDYPMADRCPTFVTAAS